MPIYEFYCADCHTVFSFFARKPDTAKRPACPRCGKSRLDRQFSTVATPRRSSESKNQKEPLADMDEAKMERLFSEMARETEGMNEDDPRQAAHMMRKLYETTGMQLGGDMEEAMRRIEDGEDPDKVEEQMGDLFDEDGSPPEEGQSAFRKLSRRLKPPSVDETLYDL